MADLKAFHSRGVSLVRSITLGNHYSIYDFSLNCITFNSLHSQLSITLEQPQITSTEKNNLNQIK